MLRTIDMLESGGWIARGFEPVGEAFAANFEDHGDLGAACCVYRDGSPVGDLWAGFADLEEGRFWADGTIQLAIPGRWALCHKAGLAAVDGELILEQVLGWQPMVAAIAAQEPNWEPGSAHGYHAR